MMARFGRWACLAALAGSLAGTAEAHHPGSHAVRLPDGSVRLEAVAMAPNLCTSIANIRLGSPPAVTPPPGSAAVTARLKREGEVCAAAVTAVRSEAILDVPQSEKQLFLYIEGPDGVLAATERVPIR